jgi:two-component system chemotaxis response regulator CheY
MTVDIPNILIIEDSTAIRLFVQQVLQGAGYNVVTASGGLSGVEQSKKSDFDVIIVDYHMPDMNGDRVTKTIRARPNGKNIPILIMTTNSDPEIKSQFKQIGANGWLKKPLESTRILTAVHNMLIKTKG